MGSTERVMSVDATLPDVVLSDSTLTQPSASTVAGSKATTMMIANNIARNLLNFFITQNLTLSRFPPNLTFGRFEKSFLSTPLRANGRREGIGISFNMNMIPFFCHFVNSSLSLFLVFSLLSRNYHKKITVFLHPRITFSVFCLFLFHVLE